MPEMRGTHDTVNHDDEEAFRFLKEVVKPKIRSKRSNELDMGKSTGIMT